MDYATFKLIQRGILQVIPGTTLTVPTHLPQGAMIRLEREISAFKPDGTIALAGEAYHWLVVVYSPAGEVRRFNPAGVGKRPAWSQAMVDNEVRILAKRAAKAWREVRAREVARKAEQDRIQRAVMLRKAYFHSEFEANAKAARKVPPGRYAMDQQSKLWKVVARTEAGVALQAVGRHGLLDETTTVCAKTRLWQIRKDEHAQIEAACNRVYRRTVEEVS